MSTALLGNANNGLPNYEEALALERDPTIPDAALPTPSSLARRIMFRGEWFTVTGLAAAIGKPTKSGQSLVYQTISVMKKIGFHFEKRPLGSRELDRMGEGRGGPAEIRLRNPGHTPSKALLDVYRKGAPNGRDAHKTQRDVQPPADQSTAEARRRKDRERKRRAAASRELAVPEPIEDARPLVPMPTIGIDSLVASLTRGVDPFDQ